MGALTFDEFKPKQSEALTFDEFANDAPPLDFRERNLRDIQARGDMGREIIGRFKKQVSRDPVGQTVSTGIQLLGNVGAGSVADIVGNEIGSVARYANDLVPEAVKTPIAGAAQKIASSKPGRVAGQALNAIGSAYKAVDKAMPDLTGTIGGAAQLFGAANAAKIGSSAVKSVGNAVPNIGQAGVGSAFDVGSAAFQKKRNDFVQNLITPKLTPTTKADLFSKSVESGPLNKRVAVPDSYESAVMDTVSQTPVKKSNSLLKNRMIIDQARNQEANTLKDALSQSKVIYSPSDMNPRLKNAINGLIDDNPLIVGDGEQVANRVANKMFNLINQNPGTPAGLLKARQEFDRWALSKQKGTFDGTSNAFKEAVRAIRGTANDYIGEMVPDAAVKASLTKQSHLFEAADAINSKGAAEASTNVGRFVQKVDRSLPGNKITRPIAGATAAAIGAGAYYGSK